MDEEDYLQLSGIQHFVFCPRQWQLIHVDGLWQENYLTLEGNLFHKHAHDSTQIEMRDGILIMREVHLRSDALQISGMTDVLEFHPDDNGIEIRGYSGRWMPFPVEYKHGSKKTFYADSLQVCAEAMCLEEMMNCHISEGALFYGKTKHREPIVFDDNIRKLVADTFKQMHLLYKNHQAVNYAYDQKCDSCSLQDICQPKLKKNVAQYLRESL